MKVTVNVQVLCDFWQPLYTKTGVIQLATVSATNSTDRNVNLSVDVGQLKVIFFFDNGICTYRIFIRSGSVL